MGDTMERPVYQRSKPLLCRSMARKFLYGAGIDQGPKVCQQLIGSIPFWHKGEIDDRCVLCPLTHVGYVPSVDQSAFYKKVAQSVPMPPDLDAL